MCVDPSDVNLAASGEAIMGPRTLQSNDCKANLSLIRGQSRHDSTGVEGLGAELRQTITKRLHLGLVSLHNPGHLGSTHFS